MKPPGINLQHSSPISVEIKHVQIAIRNGHPFKTHYDVRRQVEKQTIDSTLELLITVVDAANGELGCFNSKSLIAIMSTTSLQYQMMTQVSSC